MNSFEKYLDVLPEIQQALDENKPVVALESTILSHGMPYPENLDFAHRVEEVIRSLGGIPATCAIVKGRLKVGLTAEELEIMCRAENIGKVSRRDVAVYVALGRTGATTVASTMIIAAMAGIPVFWSVQLGIVPEPLRLSQTRGGHLRLIIGFDEAKKTLIFSDSWGAAHTEKEMPLADAIAITTGRQVMQPSK